MVEKRLIRNEKDNYMDSVEEMIKGAMDRQK